MANFFRLFLTKTHQRTLFALLWAAVFVPILALLAGFASYQVGESMRAIASISVDHYAALRAKTIATLDVLNEQITAEPCTGEFHAQLRRIAYLPDGINEFLYVPKGVAQCSVNVNQFLKPVDLGAPDIGASDPYGLIIWIDQNLDFLDLNGLTGTIFARGSFAAVVPAQPAPETAPSWMKQQVVLLGEDGQWWHRSGESGILERMRQADSGRQSPILAGAFYQFTCTPSMEPYCVVTEATLPNLFAFGLGWVLAALVGAWLFSAWLANRLRSAIGWYWSFEVRFRRNMNADTIICLYQPIMAVQSGEVAGCEVLVRWRDIDGTVVTPDQFLPIVERHQMTKLLTNLVVKRAAEELSEHLPTGRRMLVFLNIFPRDLESHWLMEALSPFHALRHRFDLVVEIVENDQVSVELAQHEIELLRANGVRTFIDDFGAGYSNIQNLAALSVDGVKLDRAFGMSPDGSLMARLLTNVIDMVHVSGRALVVEGIETIERFEAIRATGRVDYAQGFYFSRPLGIGQLAKYVVARDKASGKSAPRLVA